MAKKNDDFFLEKKAWSVVKDELLGCYFKPYVSKILHTYKPLMYVDCFAGKGKFDDGNPGSPLIALDIISQCQASTTVTDTSIEATFIDLNYAADLQENLKDYPWAKIISGKYEDNIRNILKNKIGYNVFLYIDPYGIKALQCTLFDDFARGRFNSIELLINMNSFGFIREACHAMGATFDDKEIFDDLVEYDPTKMDASDKSIKELNEIAGGDYWQPIIASYKKHEINGYDAETQFAEQYCMRLMQSYTYVLNMPLRIKRNQRPKYRLIYATNHRDGCLLMVDNICNRWQALQEIQSGGQLQLWEENYDNQIVDDDDIEKKTIEHFSQCDNWTSLHEALAVFFMKHGPICCTGAIKNILKKLEKDGRLNVLRNPDKSEKTKKPTTFMTESSKQSVSVRWRA
jgi:three-Cys-motif partner protein